MVNSERVLRREFLKRSVCAGAAAAAAPHLLTTFAAASPAEGGAGYTIGCYTRPWDKYDYRVALDAIAEAGFRHAGMMTTKTTPKTPGNLVLSAASTLETAAEVGSECKKRGLEIPSVYGGGIPVDKSLEAGIKGLRHLIDVCAVAGAKMLLMGGTNEKLQEPYFKAIAECCDYAAEKGLGLNLKPHGPVTTTGPLLRKVVESVGKKNFTVCYDAGNVFFYSDGKVNPVDDAPSVAGLVSGWCIKDFTLTPKKDVWLTPGTGLVNFPAVFAKLRQGGFHCGALVVETITRGDGGALPQLVAEARKARKFVENLVRGGG
jgi:sugar phosphate isomerase/epimerase